MSIRRRLRRAIGRPVAAVLVVLGLTGCNAMGNPTPEELFTGKQFDAARAIQAGDTERLRRLAAELEDIDAPGEKGMTLLWYAIQEDSLDSIRVLVELGSQPDEQIVSGIGSVIDYAIFHDDTRFLEAMLDGGLDVDHQLDESLTLLHRAAGPGGGLDHVQALVKRGAKINARSQVNVTPLLEAIDTSKPDVAEYLVKQGADVNAITGRGASVLYAVQDIIENQQSGSEMRQDYKRLRDLMIEKGAKHPPESAEEVRQRAQRQGFQEVPASLDQLRYD